MCYNLFYTLKFSFLSIFLKSYLVVVVEVVVDVVEVVEVVVLKHVYSCSQSETKIFSEEIIS